MLVLHCCSATRKQVHSITNLALQSDSRLLLYSGGSEKKEIYTTTKKNKILLLKRSVMNFLWTMS
jgi:hypothetical protein